MKKRISPLGGAEVIDSGFREIKGSGFHKLRYMKEQRNLSYRYNMIQDFSLIFASRVLEMDVVFLSKYNEARDRKS